MQVLLKLDGTTAANGTPLLMHNERLSDPLDPMAKALAEVTGKRKKTEADHLEVARREFIGGLYTNGNGPCLPTMNVLRCLQEGAKRHKRGLDVIRGVHPLGDHVDVQYDGPRDPDALWKKRERYALRKGVGVSGRKVIRTRPMFIDWKAEVPVEVDPVVFDIEQLIVPWADAGKYVGIGDMRPIHGRFNGTLEEIQ